MPDFIATSLAKAAGGLENAFRLVGLRLLGKVIEFPEVWLDGKIQGMRDLTAARSEIAKAAVAKAIADGSKHPELWGATTEHLLGDFDRKLTNKVAVFRGALEDAAENGSETEPPENLDEDWLNVFGRYAEDASSEKLRALYSRILSGEIRKKGSFSISTLRIMSELSQEMADAFSSVHADSLQGFLPDTKKYSSGINLMKMQRLIDAGFLSSRTLEISSTPGARVEEGYEFFVVTCSADPQLVVEYRRKIASHVPYIGTPSISVRLFTEMGSQIASLLPPQDLEGNLRALAAEISEDSQFNEAELRFLDGRIETLATRSMDV